MHTHRSLFLIVTSILMLLATLHAAAAVSRTTNDASPEFIPGTLPTVKGTVNLGSSSPQNFLNPNRPSRALSYLSAPRQSYRAGVFDYYDQTKLKREQSRPPAESSYDKIQASKRGTFIKNAPTVYPYPGGLGLRQQIASSRQSLLERKKPAMSSSTDEQGGGNA